MKSKIFLPFVPPGGSKSKQRQKFIRDVKDYLIANRLLRGYVEGSHLKAIVCFHYMTEQTKDIDNSLKGLFDATKGLLYRDDQDIKDVHAKIITDSDKVGIDIRIFKLK